MATDTFIWAALHLYRRIALFQGLEDNLLLEIAGISHYKSLEKKQVLFHCGQKPFGSFVVAEGSISHRTEKGGIGERVITVITPQQSFAEGTLVAHANYPVSAQAEEKSLVMVIDRRNFLAIMARHPELSLRIMEAMGRRARMIVDRIGGLRSRDSEEPLIRWLLKGHEEKVGNVGYEVPMRKTKRLLAEELGIAPETLSRCLARLNECNLIKKQGREIWVTDPEGLRCRCPRRGP